MQKFCCDCCDKEVTDADDYLYISGGTLYIGTDEVSFDNLILCSKACAFKYFDELGEW